MMKSQRYFFLQTIGVQLSDTVEFNFYGAHKIDL